MTEQTKKYLIVGGGLVLAVIVGIIVYKKYEAGANASQAAADQSTQDELAYLEAQGANNAYGGGFSGVGSIGVASPSSAGGTTLAEEIQSIEQAFGFGTSASSPSAAGAPPSGSAPSGGAPAPAGSTPPKKVANPLPVPPQQERRAPEWHTLMEETPADFAREGVNVA